MLILSFETKDNLDKLDKPIQAVAREEFSEIGNFQIELAKAYIGQGLYPHGFHPRRPLDQFSYTSRREEQIMPNLARKPDNKPMAAAAALMVDQLWLWMLDDGTPARFKRLICVIELTPAYIKEPW
jgi:hypothetical protein